MQRDLAAKTGFRTFMFNCGDCLFLIVVGVIATGVMHMVHHLGWHIVLTLAVGMVAAMFAQMLLAHAVAPVLGSIESMVPSMVAAMIIPMAVCLLELAGISLNNSSAVIIGATGGIGVFLLLRLYAVRCRKCFCALYKS
ncbi:MAG: hypothetical protein AB7U82_06475 [Blastocatellales bacterium]|jgi:hypothetical protein